MNIHGDCVTLEVVWLVKIVIIIAVIKKKRVFKEIFYINFLVKAVCQENHKRKQQTLP